MSLFRKRKERTEDDRLDNLRAINRSFSSVGVYRENGMSPYFLECHIGQAIEDMEALILENRKLRSERLEKSDG